MITLTPIREVIFKLHCGSYFTCTWSAYCKILMKTTGTTPQSAIHSPTVAVTINQT